MKKRVLVVLVVTAIILMVGVFLYVSGQKDIGANKVETRAGQYAGHLAGHEQPSGHQAGHQAQKVKDPFEEEFFEEKVPTIEISPDKQQLMGVKTEEAGLRPLEKITRTVGRVTYDETRQATVNTKVEGWIERLYVDYTGRYVKKGEPLADIYSPELVATQQEYLNVLRWAKAGEKNQNLSGGDFLNQMLSGDAGALVEGARQRLKLFDITDGEIKRIEESGKPIRALTIYSPVSGYVVEKTAIKGMKVMPGERLFDIADLSSLWILADIYEPELALINVGQKAGITLSYFPGREFASRVDYIYPTLSGDTRTAKARFTIPNPGGKLKPQMFANVEIKTPLGRRLAVSASAIIDTGVRQLAYVDRGGGLFEPREVTVGVRASVEGEGGRAEVVEILKGLNAGERVAVSATFLIDSESRLRGVIH